MGFLDSVSDDVHKTIRIVHRVNRRSSDSLNRKKPEGLESCDKIEIEHVHPTAVESNRSLGQNSPARASKHELGGLCSSCRRPFLQQQQGRKRSRTRVSGRVAVVRETLNCRGGGVVSCCNHLLVVKLLQRNK
jgi:hypothetical protein